ncbi:MAG: DUF2752 domain-containing protein [Chthoniobacterales bacterium]
MNVFPSSQIRLTNRARLFRVAALAAMILAALALRAFSPGWLPLRASCGAVTGLPCIFCGTTRALHFLLLGDFGRALYFNWLAFVVAAAALILAGVFVAEFFLRRRVLLLPTFAVTPGRIAGFAGGLIALWIFQVTLAVSLHKHELLNPHGPLYSLVVK